MKTHPHYLESALTAARVRSRQACLSARLTPAEQEDLQQEILLDLLKRADGYDPTKGSPGTFTGLISQHCTDDFLRRLNSDRARISFGFGAPSANDLDAEPEDSALDDSTEPLWSQDQDLFAQSDTLHDLQIALAYMNDEQRNLFELLKVHQTLPDACKACGTASATFYRRFADLQMHLRMFGFKAAA